MMTEFFIIIYLHYGNVLGSSCIEITSGAIHKCSQPHLDRLSVCHFSFFLKREKNYFHYQNFSSIQMTYIFISIQYLFSQRKKFQKLKVKECKKLHNIKGFLCSMGKIIVTS